jgi:hypothetical protein
MNRSPELNEFAKALSEVQKEALLAAENSVNPQFHSKYADLASVWGACRKALTSHGFAVTQTTDIDPEGVVLETTLMHTSGQWITGRYPVNPIKPDPQSLGSALTYARRFALCAMVGIIAGDDDGEASVGRKEADVNSPAMDATIEKVTGEVLEYHAGTNTYKKPEWIHFIGAVASKYGIECMYKEELAKMSHDDLQAYGTAVLSKAHDKKASA